MSGPRFVAFAGSWSSPSKTRALVAEAARRATARFGGTAHVFDIADLGPDFGSQRSIADLDAPARAHLDALTGADALIIASPVYKGSYAGLFKHVFDLTDPVALAGKPVLLGANGGGEKHALVIEQHLRPLFGFFEAHTLATGIYVSSGDFNDGLLRADAALTRLDRGIGQFANFLPATHRAGAIAAA